MPSDGSLFLCGVVSFATLVALSVVLSARRLVPTSVAVTLIVVGLGSLWAFPTVGKEGKLGLPGGITIERAAQRAEQAASKAVAEREEIERLASQVKEAHRRIEVVHQEMRAAFKSMVETVYLSIGTRSIFPPPPQVNDRMLKGLDVVANYVFPDPQQREPWIREMVDVVKAAQLPGLKK